MFGSLQMALFASMRKVMGQKRRCLAPHERLCFMPCRRTGKAVSPPLIQAKEELFHLFTTRLGKSTAFADPREAAFFQDAQRANVVFSGTSVQRTYLAVF